MVVKAGLVSAVLAVAGVAGAGAGWAEPVRFASAVVEPTPFLRRFAQEHGRVAAARPGEMVGGDLFRPAGAGPFPALVLLHGCESGDATVARRQQQAERYVAQGYAVLAVDSFGPRGIEQDCVSVRGEPAADRIADAYGALDFLAGQPFVNAARVGLLGAAQGGSAVLLALSPIGTEQRPGRQFAAGVAFYPACSPVAATVSAPVLVLTGALDRWASAADCEVMAALPHGGGAAVKLVVLSGAHHGFDAEALRDGPREAFGYHLEFNAAAAAAANADAAGFLAGVLKQ